MGPAESLLLRRIPTLALAPVLSAALTSGGCAEPLDPTRAVPERGTLGHELHRLLHRDLTRHAPLRADAFARERAPFVFAVDAVVPATELEATQAALVALLPLYDDEILPPLTRELARGLERFRADPAAVAAAAVLLHREGYRPAADHDPLLAQIALGPELEPLIRGLVEFSRRHDGETGASTDLVPRLQSALSEHLIAAPPADGLVAGLRALLLEEDPRWAEAGPVWAVARDGRGVPLVQPDRLPSTFVDLDPADGRPDLDPLGRFLGPGGDPMRLPPFGTGSGHDEAGRRLGPDGAPVFAYLDLDRTLVAVALREGRAALEADLVEPAVRLLARLTAAPRDPGPLTELVHAATRAVPPRQALPLLELVEAAITAHRSALALTLVELDAVAEVLDRSPPAALEPVSTFEDELLAWARALLAEPGLAEGLLAVLERPQTRSLPAALAALAAYGKPRLTEADARAGAVFDRRVDRTRPDVPDNLSFLQRMLHVIYDTRGAAYEPRLVGVPLGFVFEIEDLADFYLRSIVGEAEVPALVAALTGLSRRPTPSELAIFINEDQTFGNPRGHEGVDVRDNDGDSLFALDASRLDRAIEPVVELFHRRGRLDLLLDLLELFHLHWASPEGAWYQSQDPRGRRFSRLSGLVRFEGAIAEVFATTEAWRSTAELLAGLGATPPGRVHPRDLLAELGRHLLAVDPALRTRGGEGEVSLDGRIRTPLTPLDLLRAALDRAEQRLERPPSRVHDAEAWLAHLRARLLEVERVPGGARFVRGAGLALLEGLLRRAIAAVREAGPDEPGWRVAAVEAAAEALSEPLLPAGLSVAEAGLADAPVRDAVGRLTARLLGDPEAFEELLRAAGDAIGASGPDALSQPLVAFLGAELHPVRGHRAQVVRAIAGALAARAPSVDVGAYLIRAVQRGLAPRPGGGLVGEGLIEALAAVQRTDPAEQGPLTPDDLERITEWAHRTLLDDRHGVEKLYRLIAGRGAPQTRPGSQEGPR